MVVLTAARVATGLSSGRARFVRWTSGSLLVAGGLWLAMKGECTAATLLATPPVGGLISGCAHSDSRHLAVRQVHSMSALQRDRYRKKLGKLLSRAPDADFLQLMWAVDALQSNRVDSVIGLLSYPPDAATSAITAPLSLHRWELETLTQQLFLTPKDGPHEKNSRITNCAEFSAAAAAVKFLRSLENAEASIYLKRMDVLREMPRIGHREFPWQRGYLNVPQFYRYAFIYGQGACAVYFERTYGLSMNQFSLIGFALFAAITKRVWIRHPYPLSAFGISPEVMDVAMSLLSKPIEQARALTAKLVRETNEKRGSILPIAYQPSFLRQFPIVLFGERMCSPLRDLILLRITSGIYYDLVSGPANLRNEAADRFEAYAADYIAALMPRFAVERSQTYPFHGNEVHTPDITLRAADEIIAAIECKATKLTFAAQYSDDPVAEASREYKEIAKGVFQLWRYFSHVRRGIVPGTTLRPDVVGVVLTLDTWLVMSGPIIKEVFSTAEALSAEDPEITVADRRPVTFCHTADLESTLSTTDEDGFLATLIAATTEHYSGWMLPDVLRDIGKQLGQQKPFPFELGNVLPWWDETEKLKQQQEQTG